VSDPVDTLTSKLMEARAEVERLRAVADIAGELAQHDCQDCREHWDVPREEIMMRLAIALDHARRPLEQPR
jgi:hypothetical protein